MAEVFINSKKDKIMANCPCCSDILLRHLSSGKLFLMCQSCKIQIPADAIPGDDDTDESGYLSPQSLVATPASAALKA